MSLINSPSSFAGICKNISRSVCNILTVTEIHEKKELESFFFPRSPHKTRERRAIGSGVIIRSDGLIVTNDHVVGNSPDTIEITIPNEDKIFEAEVICRDSLRDLALIKIIKIPQNLCIAKLGTTEKCEVGDRVLAIGNNLGFQGTVTDGIISALGRSNDPRLPFRAPLIQTNACINPGSSGGALYNVKGQLIGINESIVTNTGTNIGIGFAIPINFLYPLLRSQNNEESEITRVWDGITLKQIINGVEIKDVHKESPAYQIGLRIKDVILSIDDIILNQPEKHMLLIISSEPNQMRRYIVRTNEEIRVVNMMMQSLPLPTDPILISDSNNPLNGCVIVEMCPSLNLDFGFDLSSRGVCIWEIELNTLAAALRFHSGDIIKKVGTKTIRSIDDCQKLSINRFGNRNQQMKFILIRDGKRLTREFVVRPSWRRNLRKSQI